AQLLERGFNSQNPLAWLTPSLGAVESLQPVAVDPPNMRDQMCGGHRKRPASEDEDDLVAENSNPDSPYAAFVASLRPGKGKARVPAAGCADGRAGPRLYRHHAAGARDVSGGMEDVEAEGG